MPRKGKKKFIRVPKIEDDHIPMEREVFSQETDDDIPMDNPDEGIVEENIQEVDD